MADTIKTVILLSYLYSNTCLYLKSKLVSPIITYSDPLSIKRQIILSNKRKSGIYLWTNTLTNDTYVGRSIHLGVRLSYYFNSNKLKEAKNSLICRSLLKYGYQNFKLEILEYCSKSIVAEREAYWITKLNPTYNLVKVVDGEFKFTHTIETKNKMKVSQQERFSDPDQKKQLSELHEKWAKSPENLSQLAEAQRKWWSKEENQAKSMPILKRKKVTVLDTQTNIETIYPSGVEAAKSIGCAQSALSYWYNKAEPKSPLKGRYLIKSMGEK